MNLMMIDVLFFSLSISISLVARLLMNRKKSCVLKFFTQKYFNLVVQIAIDVHVNLSFRSNAEGAQGLRCWSVPPLSSFHKCHLFSCCRRFFSLSSSCSKLNYFDKYTSVNRHCFVSVYKRTHMLLYLYPLLVSRFRFNLRVETTLSLPHSHGIFSGQTVIIDSNSTRHLFASKAYRK